MYKKNKPLTCICGAENLEVFNENENFVMLFCFECSTRNYLNKAEYYKQFDQWLSLKIEKLRLISSTNKNNN
jgi:hypothetical protein